MYWLCFIPFFDFKWSSSSSTTYTLFSDVAWWVALYPPLLTAIKTKCWLEKGNQFRDVQANRIPQNCCILKAITQRRNNKFFFFFFGQENKTDKTFSYVRFCVQRGWGGMDIERSCCRTIACRTRLRRRNGRYFLLFGRLTKYPRTDVNVSKKVNPQRPNTIRVLKGEGSNSLFCHVPCSSSSVLFVHIKTVRRRRRRRRRRKTGIQAKKHTQYTKKRFVSPKKTVLGLLFTSWLWMFWRENKREKVFYRVKWQVRTVHASSFVVVVVLCIIMHGKGSRLLYRREKPSPFSFSNNNNNTRNKSNVLFFSTSPSRSSSSNSNNNNNTEQSILVGAYTGGAVKRAYITSPPWWYLLSTSLGSARTGCSSLYPRAENNKKGGMVPSAFIRLSNQFISLSTHYQHI